jgi:hypothetical protein
VLRDQSRFLAVSLATAYSRSRHVHVHSTDLSTTNAKTIRLMSQRGSTACTSRSCELRLNRPSAFSDVMVMMRGEPHFLLSNFMLKVQTKPKVYFEIQNQLIITKFWTNTKKLQTHSRCRVTSSSLKHSINHEQSYRCSNLGQWYVQSKHLQVDNTYGGQEYTRLILELQASSSRNNTSQLFKPAQTWTSKQSTLVL